MYVYIYNIYIYIGIYIIYIYIYIYYLNEPELRSDTNEFCRRMRLKWYFRDDSEDFSEVPVLSRNLGDNHL